jgi:tartrate-resistant acid phosphatase type 5
MIAQILQLFGLLLLVVFFGGCVYYARRLGCLHQRLRVNRSIHVKPRSDEIRMLILGDTGSGSEDQWQVARASAGTCAEKGCDLAFLLGDNFIQNGVTGVDDPQFQAKFETVYPHNIPFFAVLGNHDLKGDWRAQIAYTNRSRRWTMPDVNYQFEAGPVFVQAINSTCTIRSLWTLFKSSRKPWRILCCHKPLVTNGRHPGMLGLERWFVERAGVQLVFAGHNAGLEHLRYRQIDQVVSGGGGTSLPDFVDRSSPYKRFHHHGFGYVWTHFTRDEVQSVYYDSSGSEIYRFRRTLSEC